MTGKTYGVPTINVEIPVGCRVTLMKDVSIEDNDEGSMASVFFEDYVERHVPKTGLLEFEDSDIGRAEFENLLDEADGVEVLKE